MTQTPPVDEVRIAEAVRVLEAGGLVAMPTETVYGLAADADNESAVLSTYAAKGRPADHPLIVHVAGIDAISHWAEDVPPEAWLLAKKYWPGPLTLVLKKKARCGLWVTGGQDTVALRCRPIPGLMRSSRPSRVRPGAASRRLRPTHSGASARRAPHTSPKTSASSPKASSA